MKSETVTVHHPEVGDIVHTYCGGNRVPMRFTIERILSECGEDFAVFCDTEIPVDGLAWNETDEEWEFAEGI